MRRYNLVLLSVAILMALQAQAQIPAAIIAAAAAGGRRPYVAQGYLITRSGDTVRGWFSTEGKLVSLYQSKDTGMGREISPDTITGLTLFHPVSSQPTRYWYVAVRRTLMREVYTGRLRFYDANISPKMSSGIWCVVAQDTATGAMRILPCSFRSTRTELVRFLNSEAGTNFKRSDFATSLHVIKAIDSLVILGPAPRKAG